VGGRGGEQDAVAEVAVSENVAWLARSSAEDGKAVRGCGAKAGPRLEEGGFCKRGQQARGVGIKREDVAGMHGKVEAKVLDSGSDDGAISVGTFGAGGDVDVLGADDGLERKRARKGDGEHLDLARRDRCGRPGTHTVDEVRSGENAGGGVDADTIGVCGNPFERRVLAEVDAGVADGC
jgi:hypothetical protein